MGIFDVFKTKITEAADKVGEAAGDMKDKVSDMMDKKDGAGAPDQAAQAAQTVQDQAGQAGDQMTGDVHNAEEMVSEGSPDAPPPTPGPEGGGGMMGTIKENMATGADKAGEFAKDKTPDQLDDKIDTGVQSAKDRLQG